VPRASRLLLVPALGLPLVGASLVDCNLLIGADDYSVGPVWGCVGSPMPAAGDAVTLTLDIRHFGGAPVQGVAVKACDRLDKTCTSPIAAPIYSDDTGMATISVPSDVNDFYLDLSGTLPLPDGGADAGDGGAGGESLMETLIFVSPPPTKDRTLSDVFVGTYDEYVTLVQAGTGMVLPGTGALLVHTLDCLDPPEPEPGVMLSLDPGFSMGVDPFYFSDGSPVPGATQTDSEGVGGFADVMAPGGSGSPQITATLAANGETIAVSTVTVRPKTLTEIWLSPNL
jgi:hypothetical protein